jgi:hypothetical protein
MTADMLLSKLDGVKQVGHGRWRARCPAHDAKNPTVLSIGETTDGTTLVKCFAGCNVSEVVAAVGLELADLFPRLEWQSTGTSRATSTAPAGRLAGADDGQAGSGSCTRPRRVRGASLSC